MRVSIRCCPPGDMAVGSPGSGILLTPMASSVQAYTRFLIILVAHLLIVAVGGGRYLFGLPDRDGVSVLINNSYRLINGPCIRIGISRLGSVVGLIPRLTRLIGGGRRRRLIVRLVIRMLDDRAGRKRPEGA